MRKYGRVDANQPALVAVAVAFGASWLSLTAVGDGCPDGLLGYHGKTWLVEFKTAEGCLTEDQRAFIARWRGSPVYVVRSAAELEHLLKSAVQNRRLPATSK